MFKDILDALPESTPEQRADKSKAMMTVLSRCLRLNRKLACVTKGCKHSKLFNPLKAPKTRTQMFSSAPPAYTCGTRPALLVRPAPFLLFVLFLIKRTLKKKKKGASRSSGP